MLIRGEWLILRRELRAALRRRRLAAVLATLSITAMSTIGSFALLFGMLAVEVIDLFVCPERYYVERSDYWSAEPALLPMMSPLWSYLYYFADLRVVFGEFGIPRLAHYWVFSQALAVIITLALFQFAVLYFRRYRMRDV